MHIDDVPQIEELWQKVIRNVRKYEKENREGRTQDK